MVQLGLVIAAIAAGIIGLRTLRAIERQVIANEDAANAAARAAKPPNDLTNKREKWLKELRAYVL